MMAALYSRRNFLHKFRFDVLDHPNNNSDEDTCSSTADEAEEEEEFHNYKEVETDHDVDEQDNTFATQDRLTNSLQGSNSNSQATTPNSSSATSTTKSVRFDFSATEIYEMDHHDRPYPSHSIEEKELLWYSREDYKTFYTSDEARFLYSKPSPQGGGGGGITYQRVIEELLTACYQKAAAIPLLLAKNGEKVEEEEEVLVIDPYLRVGFVQLVSADPSLVGMERTASPRVADDIMDRHRQLVRAVRQCYHQHQQHHYRTSTTSNPFQSHHNRDELVRLASERITRPSRLFACAVAQCCYEAM